MPGSKPNVNVPRKTTIVSPEPLVIGQKIKHARSLWFVVSREKADDLIYPYRYWVQEIEQ